MAVQIPGLFANTFYLPSHIVKQLGLVRDSLKDGFIGLLRGSILRPSIVATYASDWYERVTAPIWRVPTSY